MNKERINVNTGLLYDLALWQNGAAFINSDFDGEGLPIIKIGELNGGITSETKLTSKKLNEKYHISNGDLLFSWSGNPDTSIKIFKYSFGEAWLNQHIWKVTKTDERLDSKYFYYLLESLLPQFIHIAKNKQTTGLGHVTIKDLKRINVGFPNLVKQKQITSVLSSVDDKIELNRKMNEVLEEIGQLLFRHWFVDFEFPWDFKKNEFSWDGKPYKCSGGEMVESELGKIPKGWEVKPVNSFVDFLPGYSFRSRDYIENGKYKIITIKSVQNGYFSEIGSDTIDTIPDNLSNSCHINDGDILMSLTGNVGRVCLAYGENLLLNQRVVKLYSSERSACTYFLFMSSSFTKKMKSLAGGAAQENLSPIEVGKLRVPVSVSAVSDAFEQCTKNFIDRIILNNIENKLISQTRDLLLPRLMSGKLRVPIK